MLYIHILIILKFLKSSSQITILFNSNITVNFSVSTLKKFKILPAEPENLIILKNEISTDFILLNNISNGLIELEHFCIDFEKFLDLNSMATRLEMVVFNINLFYLNYIVLTFFNTETFLSQIWEKELFIKQYKLINDLSENELSKVVLIRKTLESCNINYCYTYEKEFCLYLGIVTSYKLKDKNVEEDFIAENTFNIFITPTFIRKFSLLCISKDELCYEYSSVLALIFKIEQCKYHFIADNDVSHFNLMFIGNVINPINITTMEMAYTYQSMNYLSMTFYSIINTTKHLKMMCGYDIRSEQVCLLNFKNIEKLTLISISERFLPLSELSLPSSNKLRLETLTFERFMIKNFNGNFLLNAKTVKFNNCIFISSETTERLLKNCCIDNKELLSVHYRILGPYIAFRNVYDGLSNIETLSIAADSCDENLLLSILNKNSVTKNVKSLYCLDLYITNNLFELFFMIENLNKLIIMCKKSNSDILKIPSNALCNKLEELHLVFYFSSKVSVDLQHIESFYNLRTFVLSSLSATDMLYITISNECFSKIVTLHLSITDSQADQLRLNELALNLKKLRIYIDNQHRKHLSFLLSNEIIKSNINNLQLNISNLDTEIYKNLLNLKNLSSLELKLRNNMRNTTSALFDFLSTCNLQVLIVNPIVISSNSFKFLTAITEITELHLHLEDNFLLCYNKLPNPKNFFNRVTFLCIKYLNYDFDSVELCVIQKLFVNLEILKIITKFRSGYRRVLDNFRSFIVIID